jgi:adenosylcobinamide-GDP ribazoletransferase
MSDETDHRNRAMPEAGLRARAVDLARCLRFYSRLPVPALPWEGDPYGLPEFRRMTPVVPLAGLLLGLPSALCLAAALALDLGSWLAAALAVAAATLATGAFHEDGLADTADGFGGGATPERRLAIMKDSLIGSFGASALALAFALRIIALATLVDRTGSAALTAVLVAAVLSRTAGLMPLTFLPPARLDGASYAVGQPDREAFWQSCAFAALLSVLVGASGGLPPGGIALMLALAALSGWALTRLSERMIGGQTGDVAGAVQQIAEIAALIGLLIAVEP